MKHVLKAMVLVLVLWSATVFAGATLYKCQVAGKVVYQDTQCDPSRASTTTATAPNTLHNGTTDADSKEAFMCMTLDAQKNNVPLTVDSKIRAAKIPRKEWARLDCD
jgi:hypothetical protein